MARLRPRVLCAAAENGDLTRLVNTHKPGKVLLTERIVLDLFVQICLGMAYVHRKKVLHRCVRRGGAPVHVNATCVPPCLRMRRDWGRPGSALLPLLAQRVRGSR